MLVVLGVEANNKSRSDRYYIEKFMSEFYEWNNGCDVIKWVYLGGKSKYDKLLKEANIPHTVYSLHSEEKFKNEARLAFIDFIGNEDEIKKADTAGTAIGLAWTSMGGDTLIIEAISNHGKEGMQLTGQMGDVMKESCQIAMNWAKKYVLGKKLKNQKWF